ncbi:hypothetical protein V501_01444 [Pseudogymnoascus sp. VKM F-4519 (FW-2642)]|nr:hypothetical protein V501_01444 [Pseudogymnoascus sp. VKM F-4519 (FW-2642)]
MDTHATQSPEEKTKQVAESTRDESHAVSETVATNTTSKQAIPSTETASESRGTTTTAKDEDPRTEAARRARFRKIALENAANWERPTEDTVPGLFIRTNYDTTSIPLPKKKVLSEEARKRLKEGIIPNENFMYPYQFPPFSEPSQPKDSRRG